MNRCQNPLLYEDVGKPLPTKRRGRRAPPLENQAEWGPWLPPAHPYSEIPRAMRTIVISMLALLAFLMAILFALWTAAL